MLSVSEAIFAQCLIPHSKTRRKAGAILLDLGVLHVFNGVGSFRLAFLQVPWPYDVDPVNLSNLWKIFSTCVTLFRNTLKLDSSLQQIDLHITLFLPLYMCYRKKEFHNLLNTISNVTLPTIQSDVGQVAGYFSPVAHKQGQGQLDRHRCFF